MATLEQLERALVNADKAGDADAARKLAAVITRARQDSSNRIPGTDVPGTSAQAPEPSALEKVAGVGEAALTALTGATTGTVGMLAGGGAEVARQVAGVIQDPQGYRPTQSVEQAAMSGAQALTYAPRTQPGQDYVNDVVIPAGNAMMPLAGLAGTLPASAGAARAAVRPAAQITAAAVPRAVQAVRQGAGALAERVLPDVMQPTTRAPSAGTMGSVGAAGTEMAAQRTATANSLPVPIKLTSGQATRDFEQLRFEKETAKDPARGAPLRERGEQQNAAILQNFDAWLDATGAEAPDVVAAGRAVNSALVERAARDKAQVRAAYKAADKAGEMADPVPTNAITLALNESRSAESTAPVLTAARKELVRLGGATESADGALVSAEMTLNNAEQLRKFVNKVTGVDPTNQKFAIDLKKAIDASTEGAGGEIYAKARALRAKYAETYENRAVVADLLANRRGMADPKVSVDRVFQRSILQGSPDDVQFLRRVLQTGGDSGKQAWRELQGSTMNHIRNEATRGATTDQRGNPVISPAGLNKVVQQLDKDGRLTLVFGKNGAQQLRDINEISKFVNTAPPGAINTSNTASVLLQALAEAGGFGAMTGIPVPVLSLVRAAVGHSKDRRLQQRVMRALNNEAERQTRSTRTRPVPVPSAPPVSPTVH